MELKRECDLTDEALIDKCYQWISDLCKTGGRAWTLRVPVDMERDPDILFTELISRYKCALAKNGSNTVLCKPEASAGAQGATVASEGQGEANLCADAGCPRCKSSDLLDTDDHWTHCQDCGFSFVG